MKSPLRLLLAALTLAPLMVRADRMPMPADAPPAFKAECGSCHLAFPPALLGAGDWKKVMAGLDKHYGDNASLDAKTRGLIEDFLIRNAGSAWKLGSATGDPPRLTTTDRFQRKHREISPAVWRDKRVGSAANCVACHPRAEAGNFSEHEITMPGAGGKRHERN
jgi:hypothetical protein